MTDLETARQALRDHAAVGAVGPMFERLLAEVEANVWDEGVCDCGTFDDGHPGDCRIFRTTNPYREDA